MDEEFDAVLDVSSDIDLGSDFSSNTDVFGDENLESIPDDISEDISGDLSDVSDFNSGTDDLPGNIEEDVFGDESLDFSDNSGMDIGSDEGIDSDSEDIEYSDIPEDVEEDTSFSKIDAVDVSDGIPDDLAEDAASLNEEVTPDMEDLDVIPEDKSDADTGLGFEEESSNDFDIPEDVESADSSDSLVESSDVTDGDNMQTTDDMVSDMSENDDVGDSEVPTDIMDSSISDTEDTTVVLPEDEIQEDYGSSSEMMDEAVSGEADVDDVETDESAMQKVFGEVCDGSEALSDTTEGDTQDIDLNDDMNPAFEQPELKDDASDLEDSEDTVFDSDTELTPIQELSSYMNDHNYGLGDFDEYSKDPEWQRLHEAAFPDWEGRTDFAEYHGSDVTEQMDGGVHSDAENINNEIDNMTENMGVDEIDDSTEAQASADKEESPYTYHFSGYEEHQFQEVEKPKVLNLDHGSSLDKVNLGTDDYSNDNSQVSKGGIDLASRELKELGDEANTKEELDTDSVQADLPDSGMVTPDLSSDENQNIAGDLISGQELLDRFGTGLNRNGSEYFVKGDHYDQFENDYYSPDDSSYTKYDTPQQRDISPRLIEGIHLGEREAEDPSVFWGQHKNGGTAESFQEIASHIPEVRERLAAGDTLDDLVENDRLSDCTSIYFKNMPEVIERDGYYEFNSNGRHRILAARALGYDIPVKVVGKRS